MAVQVEYHHDMGNGTVQVYSRTESGKPFNVVIGLDLLGTATMYQVLEQRARTVEREAAAQAAHNARGVS